MRIVQEIERLTHSYVRHGGKTNRRQQRSRMIAFAEFCATEGARALAEVGARHVIRYWRTTRHLSDATRYNHWCALCALWELADKLGKPPRPTLSTEGE